MSERKVQYAADLELADGPLGQNRLRQHLDDQVSVVQRVLVKRPVVITLHLKTEKTYNLTTTLEKRDIKQQ